MGKIRSNPHKVNTNKVEDDEEHVVSTMSMDYTHVKRKLSSGTGQGEGVGPDHHCDP